jgi:hypothetical protein
LVDVVPNDEVPLKCRWFPLPAIAAGTLWRMENRKTMVQNHKSNLF